MSSNDTAYAKSLLRALLLATTLVGFLAASGCGLVASDGTGSETHWLMRCEADAECSSGSCECGVCTKTCSEDAECSALGIPGVRCSLPDACSAEPPREEAPGGGCFVLCEANSDCVALGATASCERGRCELGQSSVSGGGGTSGESGAGGSTSSAGAAGSGGAGNVDTLCDGSDDVRFVSISGGGFVDEFYSFASTYGAEFYAIDGRCRYWHGFNEGLVYSGTLSEAQAQGFAMRLGFGQLSQIRYVDEYDCTDGGFRTLWSAEGNITCTCDCGNSMSSPAAFRAAFAADQMARSQLVQGGEPLSGAAQLLLVAVDAPTVSDPPEPWPLGRGPALSEILPPNTPGNGVGLIDEDSGVQVSDAAELALLRSAREAYRQRAQFFARYTPVVYYPPGPVAYYTMLLRDEAPPNVKAALQRALSNL